MFENGQISRSISDPHFGDSVCEERKWALR